MTMTMTSGGSISARGASTRSGSSTVPSTTVGHHSHTHTGSSISNTLATAHSLLVGGSGINELKESSIEQMDPFELQEKFRELQQRYQRTVQEKDEQKVIYHSPLSL
jgi:hypothetical protein